MSADGLDKTGARGRESSLLERLLAGETADASRLAYDLCGHHLGFVAGGEGGGDLLAEVTEALERPFLLLGDGIGPTSGWLGGRRAFSEDEVAQVGRSAGHGCGPLALGEPAAGPAGWRRTYRQARAAFGIVLLGARPFARYADVALAAAVLRDEDLVALLREKFALALGDREVAGRGLATTLRAYLDADCNLSSTASALGLTRRTVAGRLAAFEEAIGRPLHTCLAELDLALRLQALGLHGFACER